MGSIHFSLDSGRPCRENKDCRENYECHFSGAPGVSNESKSGHRRFSNKFNVRVFEFLANGMCALKGNFKV